MSVLFSKKPILAAVGISLLITALTYFVQLATAFGGFIPLTMQYTVLSSAETSTSTPATLFGWPFAWMLGNDAVTIFSAFAFFLDWIIFLVLSFLVLWLLLRTETVGEALKPAVKEKPTNKVTRK